MISKLPSIDDMLSIGQPKILIPDFMVQGQFKFGTVEVDSEGQVTGLSIALDIPEKEWRKATSEACEFWEHTGKAHMQAAFILGDLLVHGDEHFHDTYGDAIDATREYVRITTAKLMRWMRIAKQIEPMRRRDLLTLGHHEEVAPLVPQLQEKYLQLAIDENMTVKELRTKIRDDNPKKRKSKTSTETPAEKPATIEEQMVNCSNWCSAHFDEITPKMKGPMKKFYDIYRRKWIDKKKKAK